MKMAETKEQSILVVDDNPDDRKLFRRMLENAGYCVVEGSSGREALAAVEKTRFALMTLDLSMPDMDGFDVLRSVRARQPELKIVVVSGFLHGKMLEPAKSLGADATLDKHLAATVLVPLVCNLLTNTKWGASGNRSFRNHSGRQLPPSASGSRKPTVWSVPGCADGVHLQVRPKPTPSGLRNSSLCGERWAVDVDSLRGQGRNRQAMRK